MKIRHRIPTIFNLSMVDVLCCALGCVILLWLLNLREARQRAALAGEAAARLTTVRADLVKATQEGDKVRVELDEARRAAIEARRQADSTAELLRSARGDLTAARSRLAELDKDIASLRSKFAAAEERLIKKNKEKSDLERDMVVIRRRAADLEILLREQEKLAKATARSADDLAERLRDLDARNKQMQAQADLVLGLREEAATYRTKLEKAEARATALEKQVGARDEDLAGAGKNLREQEEAYRKLAREVAARNKELAEAGRLVESLQTDKKTLADQARRARAAAVDRFAGIALSGRRVVFLIDMSGSMELVDEQTPAPEKWSGVRESMAKIMHSLPDLEKFQVMLFSDKVIYPLGSDEGWIDYNSQTSLGRATQALAAVKPRGNTNLYIAFEAAFRFRPVGLDTIYLLSDGLPNIGPGLTPEQARSNLKETERSEILSQYLRKTLKSDWNRDMPGRPRVRINAVGFFFESPDVGAFLWALARENEGSFVGMSKP